MPNVSILAATLVDVPDGTENLPAAKPNDRTAYRVQLPIASTTLPRTDGTASPGSDPGWSRGDHRHSTDTSRASVAYVDAQDAALQGQISAVIAGNLVFLGQLHPATDVLHYKSQLSLPDGPLPDPTTVAKGNYVIVVEEGVPPGGSQIPPLPSGTPRYVRGDWLISDGTIWVFLPLGLVFSTADVVAVTPEIAGLADVQSVLEHLDANMALASDANPIANGTAAPGIDDAFARSDHIHPTDLTRYAANNPAEYVNATAAAAAAPVRTVAGRIGAITLAHIDITDWTATLQPYALTVNIPLGSSTPPIINGAAAAGTAATWARADHVHPTDTSRASRRGITDGSNAAAGDIGEFISASVQVGSAISAVSNVAIDITTMVLTPGDWDLLGQCGTQAASGGHIQHMQVWMNTVSVTPPTVFAGAFHEVGGIATGGTEQMVLPTGRLRMNVTANTTVFLTTKIQFTGSLSCYGFMSARRVR